MLFPFPFVSFLLPSLSFLSLPYPEHCLALVYGSVWGLNLGLQSLRPESFAEPLCYFPPHSPELMRSLTGWGVEDGKEVGKNTSNSFCEAWSAFICKALSLQVHCLLINEQHRNVNGNNSHFKHIKWPNLTVIETCSHKTPFYQCSFLAFLNAPLKSVRSGNWKLPTFSGDRGDWRMNKNGEEDDLVWFFTFPFHYKTFAFAYVPLSLLHRGWIAGQTLSTWGYSMRQPAYKKALPGIQALMQCLCAQTKWLWLGRGRVLKNNKSK